MPAAIIAALAKMTAMGIFVAGNKKLPIEWEPAQGKVDQKNYQDAWPKAHHSAGGPGAPSTYFFNASSNKDHKDTAKKLSDKFKTFMDECIDKTMQAIDMWRTQAKLKDLKVMALAAIGTPGCLDGPKLKDTAPYSSWTAETDNGKKWVKCVVDTMSDSWDKWASKVMVPGLPWYPAFCAYPGPMAPPMPGIPMPLITCPSPMMTELAVATKLKKALCDAHDGGLKDEDKDKQYETFYEAFATAISMNFLMWLPMQQFMTVMGKGPVPTYAPPYVPVGPVMMGDNVSAPGHTAA